MRQLKQTRTAEVPQEKPQPKRRKALTLLSAMEEIVEQAEGSKLGDEFFKEAKRPIAFVGKRLDLTPAQSVMLALFMNRCHDSRILLSELAGDVKCRTIRIFQYAADINELVRRQYLRCRKDSRSTSYYFTSGVVDALKQNRPYEPPSLRVENADELFAGIERVFDRQREDELDYEGVCSELDELFQANTHLEFIRWMQAVRDNWTQEDWLLLVYFCHLCVNNDDNNIGFRDFDGLFEPYKNYYRCARRELERGDHAMQQDGWVEYVNDDGLADRSCFKLTDKAKQELLAEVSLPQRQASDKGLLHHDTLPAKTLYYNERERRQVEELASLLMPGRFDDIRRNLESRGMRKGFACLFHGAPGTGKTETVYQLAKRTGRHIMEVNVEEIKSMWVGASEKNIKAVFDRYRAYVDKAERIPILLFNEADAIIGKRQEGAERAVDKMENSIQNIILQEMERLDGILIATTNLAQNMDKAFERRFLYKIAFDKPCLEAKQAIWQSMLPELGDREARTLATRYDFSGGQIENVARKRTVQRILYNRDTATLDELTALCDSENINSRPGSRPIGYHVA